MLRLRDYALLRVSRDNCGSLFARYAVTPEKVCFRVIGEENATVTSPENKRVIPRAFFLAV